MKVTLLNYTPNPLETIAQCAATSYKTKVNEKTIPRILETCYKSGHHSIFEFADFIFKIERLESLVINWFVIGWQALYRRVKDM